MAYVNVAEWTPEHVSDWLKGLDDEVQPYTQFFLNNGINGCHLLTLLRDDLSNLNIAKIGHQELVLEAVDLLKQLHYNLTSETLQSLALKLGCKAQSLFNHLKHISSEQTSGKKVSTDTLSAVSDILNLVKSLISWLDRYPFLGQDKYNHVGKSVLKLSVELASTAQRDQFAEEPDRVIRDICSSLLQQSDKIVQEFNDSLIIQPAVLEVAKIKRKADDDVGVHINSYCTGIHVIESIKFQSPAYRCGKVENGDEIVQVNYQTVVGWQVRNIICAMKEHPSEVHLTLKKRPRHPNVLGQVITLWPYRIPSKKTALKLYKWNKNKTAEDAADICPKSPEMQCDTNNVPENYCISIHDKERQLFFGRSRNRIKRRATITGISPTALQPPINLDDLISNNKKKQSVGRAVSYDPGKVGGADDSVFNDGPECDSKDEASKGENKDVPAAKTQFLKPPTEKYLGSCLRRQKQVIEISPQNEISDIRLMVDFAKADNVITHASTSSAPDSCPPSIPPKKDSTPGSENHRPKLDWLGKQKAKLEGMTNGNTTSNSQVNQKLRVGSTSSCPVIETTPPNSKVHGTAPVAPREGRPLLSEIRALKRAADAKLPNEKTEPLPRKNTPLLPRQNISHKRNMQQAQNKLGCSGVKYDNTKETELTRRLNGVAMLTGKRAAVNIPQNSANPKYAVIPQYPFEMHESKIVSLKQKPTQHHSRNKIRYVSDVAQNGAMGNRQESKKNFAPQKPRVIARNNPNGKANTFNPMFGRSRSFNDIAFSSDSSSSYEDDCDDVNEVYEEIDQERNAYHNSQFQPQNKHFNSQDSTNFAAKVAEVYYMLNQGHCFPSPPQNGINKPTFGPASSAIIDELAKRMYHALQQDHMKERNFTLNHGTNGFVPPTRTSRSKSLSRDCTSQEIYNRNPIGNNYYGRMPQATKEQLLYQNYPSNTRQIYQESVQEKPPNLSPPSYLPNKQTSPSAFKSATSQEILSLYTSQIANKSSNPGKQDSPPSYESSKKSPVYEPLSYFRANQQPYPPHFLHNESNLHMGQRNQMFCPAERESDSVKCNDKVISSPSDGWKYFDKGMFQPIREESLLDEETAIDEFVPLPESVHNQKSRTYSQSSNEVNMYINQCGMNPSQVDSNKIINSAFMLKSHPKGVPPSISSLVSSVPKPPEDEYCLKQRRCSDAQTETENITAPEYHTGYAKEELCSLGNDDSFCSQHSDNENPNFVRGSSSLSSSGSSSTISSTNSSYYYVDSQQSPKQLSVSLENTSDTHRSPSLPTMGVSMLSKKRPSNSGGSDSGCNSEPHQQSSEDIPTISALDSGDECPPSALITDVEHTI